MLYCGTSGWYYDDWKNVFYPSNIKKSDWLNYYSSVFNTVEVNASFYRLPFKNMVKGWKNKTPDNFIFTFKGSRLITHNKKLKNVNDYLDKFFKRITLSEKVGVVLWQLPPSLKKDIDRLEQFFDNLSTEFRHCVEFRHDSWFDPDVYDVLKKHNIAYCIISAPGLPSTIQVTTDFAYIRFHGTHEWYKHKYSKNELNGWATKIKQMNVDDIYVYFNNDYNAFAPKNAKSLIDLLK
ncbi:MAG: DUF72 domain-containing protein [Candidatus Lokiarchaeota archaeon]|nr:DUF72 domain-containing protein [Candidatus Lokiarchaeota archaeon]